MDYLTNGQRRQLADRIGGAIDEAVARALGLASRSLLPESQQQRPREIALVEVAVTEHVARMVSEFSTAAAQAAAKAGASYGDLGAAAKMTRQDARRRWPGLATAAAAAAARSQHGVPLRPRDRRDV
ncbi:hypothetical protein [Micromonospora zingiberis]|uniref:hypothetical protein n=1 Tax=Micromonospora zingiberis TaxID=2053011 RepID=UPI00198144BB|nr:hypothetical protein [Micromonospora zingiberis]